MKTTISVLLTFVLLFGSILGLGLVASAEDGPVVPFEPPISFIDYTLTDGTLLVFGIGDMDDYFQTDAPWKANAADIKAVIISDGITSIGDYAFYGLPALTSVVIGNDVATIGTSAFENCALLASVTLGDAVETVEVDAFKGCVAIKDVYTPSLEAWCAIDFANPLANPLYFYATTFHAGTAEYGSTSKNKATIVIPEGVTEIGNYAFTYAKPVSSIVLADSVETIGEGAFFGCSNLTTVTVGSGVAEIGARAFSNCTRLATVYVFSADVTKELDALDAASDLIANAKNVIFADTIEEDIIPSFFEDNFHEGTLGEDDPDTYKAFAPHTWNSGVVTKDATEEEEGEMTYTCSSCKGTRTEAIEKLPAVEAPVIDNNAGSAGETTAPETSETAAPDDEVKGGCGASIAAPAVLLAAVALAPMMARKKDEQ